MVSHKIVVATFTKYPFPLQMFGNFFCKLFVAIWTIRLFFLSKRVRGDIGPFLREAFANIFTSPVRG